MKHDHEAVKTLAIAIGVRKAARQLGLNEKRVLAWSMREAWFKTPPQPPRQGDVVTVVKPSEALAEAIADDSTPTRYALSKAHRKAAEHAQTLNGETLMQPKHAQALRLHGQGAALVHGWQESQGQAQFSLNVLNLGGSVQIGVRSGNAAAHTLDVGEGSETGKP